MHSPLRRLAFALVIVLLSACTSAPKRQPQSTLSSYNQDRVRLLRLAAAGGVLFSISDAVIRDIPVESAGDRCRRFSEGPWLNQLYETLRIFERQPQLLSKIHVIEFRRGDRAGASLSSDLVDRAVTLTLHYAKVVHTEIIENLNDIPCDDKDVSLLKRESMKTTFEWPDSATVSSVLMSAPDRPRVERYEFDRRFAGWLADRLTILRLNPELAFERSPAGQPFIPILMNQLSADLERSEPETLDYWLKEISQHSLMGAQLKFFSVVRDRQLSTGLLVESAGELARRMNGYTDPTSPYISYKLDGGQYGMVDLPRLEACLSEVRGTYRSPLASMSSYNLSDRSSFMSPGHSCSSPDADR